MSLMSIGRSTSRFTPRAGRCGMIFGAVETKDGLAPLRWGGDIGIEVVGKQGSGKTRGFVLPSLLIQDVHEDAHQWSVSQRRFHPYGYETVKVVLDIKGSITAATAGYRKSLGENVFVIDPYSKDPGIAKYNPFDNVRVFTDDMFGDCTRLAGWVCEPMSSSAESTAKYFDATAIEAMGGFIGHNAFRAVAEQDATINSPAGLITFLSGFESIEDAIQAVLQYEHDPHGLAGWTEERNGKSTGRPTKTCPWIAQTMRVLAAKADDEKSGIYGSTLKDLPIYRDPRIKPNTTSSTFRIEELVNDRTRSSIIYIRMPYADIEQLKPYVRLFVNDILHRLMPPAIVVDGREARGNLREWMFLLEECAALQKLQQIQRAASFMRGLGGKLITVWQNKNQKEETYGKLETISGNQGLHLFYTPETNDEAEELSKALGETSFVVQERNVSGDRVTVGPRSHLAEQNRIETRRNYTPYEVKALPTDELFFFSKGLQARVRQYHYDQHPELLRRSQLPPPTECDITLKVPFCIENLERELGASRFAIAISPAPDPFEAHREAAELQANGCQVYRWDRTFEDTGARTYFAQVWLPDRLKPILNDLKGYATVQLRESAIVVALGAYDVREKNELAVVKNTNDPRVAAMSIFDGEKFV